MSSRRVLVVDDEIDFVEGIRMRLEANGYEILSAHNGFDCVDRARKDSPDLILLDLVMPKSNGLEALSKLKTDPRTMHIPVVIITAKGEAEYILDAGKLGANDYMTKPVSVQAVLEMVKKYIN